MYAWGVGVKHLPAQDVVGCKCNCFWAKNKFIVSIILLQDGRTLEATSMGRISSFYYLSHQTMSHFRNTLLPVMTIPELLRVLAHVYEYSQIPVRHNEDILNG